MDEVMEQIHDEIRALDAFVRQFDHQWVELKGERVCVRCDAWERGSVSGCIELAMEHRHLAPPGVKNVLDVRARLLAQGEAFR